MTRHPSHYCTCARPNHNTYNYILVKWQLERKKEKDPRTRHMHERTRVERRAADNDRCRHGDLLPLVTPGSLVRGAAEHTYVL